jgi:hypothetical protein
MQDFLVYCAVTMLVLMGLVTIWLFVRPKADGAHKTRNACKRSFSRRNDL